MKKSTLIAAALVAAFPLAVARADAGATLGGRVLDAVSGTPVQETVVTLRPGPRVTVTSADGRFSFAGLAPGSYDLQIQRVGYDTSYFGPYTVGPGETTAVELSLDRAPRRESIVVRAPRSPPAAESEASPEQRPAADLDREEMSRAAGSLGDPARALTALPGVSSINDYKADLRLRGGEPDDVVYRLDGVTIANPYHFRLTRASIAALDPDAFDRFTVRTSALPVEVGDTISGVIELSPAERGAGGRALGVSVGTLASSLAGVGPAGEAGSWVAAGRYSNLALYRSLYQVEQLGVPAYGDLLLRARVPLTPEVDLIAGSLVLANGVALSSPDLRSTQNVSASSRTGYLGLDRSLPGGARVSARLAFAESLQTVDSNEGDALRSRGREARWSIEERREVGAGLRWRVGAEGAWLSGAIAGALHQAPGLEPLDARSTRGAAYVAAGFDLSRRWSAEAGLREDRDSRFGVAALEPRLRADYAAPSGWRAHVAASRYAQVPSFEQEFLAQSETLRITTADEVSAGAAFPLGHGVAAEVNAYAQRLRDLTAEIVNRYPDLPEPMGRFDRGRLDGLEIGLRQEVGRVRSRLAVTFLSARETRDGRQTRRDGDQPYRIDGSVAIPVGSVWHLIARLQANSGLVYNAYEPAGAGERVLGDLNGARLPAYARLDLRAQWEGRLRGARARLYLEIDNALARKNVRDRDLAWDPSLNRYVTDDDPAMPLIPGFGVELSWGP